MTEMTKVLGIRLSNEDKEYISKYLNRESVEAMIWQIKHKEIVITRKGVEFNGVNNKSGSVNTNDKSVNTPDCENCEFAFNALDMSGFDEVCEYKGLDRQKALDKCVQMLWR